MNRGICPLCLSLATPMTVNDFLSEIRSSFSVLDPAGKLNLICFKTFRTEGFITPEIWQRSFPPSLRSWQPSKREAFFPVYVPTGRMNHHISFGIRSLGFDLIFILVERWISFKAKIESWKNSQYLDKILYGIVNEIILQTVNAKQRPLCVLVMDTYDPMKL